MRGLPIRGGHRALPLALFAACLLPSGVAWAHEPIFGVGPHTVFQGGIAAEVEAEIADRALTTNTEIAYGITPDLSATVLLPLRLVSDGEGAHRFGLGDGALRLKWRALRVDSPGASDAVAGVIGVKLPTGARDEPLALGTGSTDLMAALTYGHEGRRFYAWADLRALVTTRTGSLDRGDVLFYDLAVGLRPWLLRYDEPDLVLLVELNGRHIGRTRLDGSRVDASGGETLAMGPALFFTYRNLAIKAGLSLPLWSALRGDAPPPGPEGVVAFEGHF